MHLNSKIIIHNPEEFPEKSLIAAFAQLDKVISLAIIPSVVVSQPAIRNLPLTQRECWFNDEVINFFFQINNNKIKMNYYCLEKITNNKEIQLPVMYDRMRCGHYFKSLPMYSILLS